MTKKQLQVLWFIKHHAVLNEWLSPETGATWDILNVMFAKHFHIFNVCRDLEKLGYIEDMGANLGITWITNKGKMLFIEH